MSYTFSIPDMSCGHCVARIEKALKESGKAGSYSVDLTAKKVVVETEEAPELIERIIEDVGYTPKRV